MSGEIGVESIDDNLLVIKIKDIGYLTLVCTLEHLRFLVDGAILERDMAKGLINPDEGFSKPMGPWGKEEI